MGIAKNLATAAALLSMPAAVAGQGGCGRDGKGFTVPNLGWSSFSCAHCEISMSPRHRSYSFSTEPRLNGIDGPGAGRLRWTRARLGRTANPSSVSAARKSPFCWKQ